VGLGTNVQTLFISNWLSSSSMAINQHSSVSASLIFLGSIYETKAMLLHTFLSEDRVFTPCEGSPRI
jgi:hypothetical protein